MEQICCMQLSNSKMMMKQRAVVPTLLSIKRRRQLKITASHTTMKKDNMNNFYEVLSLRSEEAGFEEIKRAYRCMALQCHPDVCHHSDKAESVRRFIQLREAYETLSDPISRQIYDHEMGLRIGCEFGNWSENRRGINNNVFCREVWERQLSGLKTRSHRKMENNRKNW